MVMARPIRVMFDAHVVGRRLTGNETYAVGLARALARRSDIDLTVLMDPGASWPTDPGGEAPPASRTLAFRRPQARIPLELPVRARRASADVLHVQYVVPPVEARKGAKDRLQGVRAVRVAGPRVHRLEHDAAVFSLVHVRQHEPPDA